MMNMKNSFFIVEILVGRWMMEAGCFKYDIKKPPAPIIKPPALLVFQIFDKMDFGRAIRFETHYYES